MSLVAYGSSDDSDSEGTSTSAATQSRGSSGGRLSLPPASKRSAGRNDGPIRETNTKPSAQDSASNDSLYLQLSSLPKPRKRTEAVKIIVPQIQKKDSDSDEDEPAKKKRQPQCVGKGLSSLLPQPKNVRAKEIARSLIPYTLTKRQEPKGPKPGMPAKGLLSSSASPSAIKAAAKSAALQVTRQINTDDQDEEDITPQNYFSLNESSPPPPAVIPSLDPEPVAPAEPLVISPADEPGQSDAPLDFGGGPEGAGAWGGPNQPPLTGPGACPQEFYDESYSQESNPTLSEEGEEPGQSAMFDDEAFMRLQGKRNRGKEEVKFLEIKGDDQLSGNQQWMTKSMTEEKQNRQSFSKKKGEGPTGQQRRKHQITYLIHQAKERELELKNSWADNKLTRRQTQAKYGF
ncbi:unnamed protein product [Pleuronectes platessa]|uniref:Proline rich mitotic checkpoint control factor n=1 Tax=Pleuronectes platessa TaxID=8262 RepID=A0A9N7YXB2_PLEPL|nr:unnamed protein product [Pleuronectes platessa]